jgi:hypothetical protein
MTASGAGTGVPPRGEQGSHLRRFFVNHPPARFFYFFIKGIQVDAVGISKATGRGEVDNLFGSREGFPRYSPLLPPPLVNFPVG